MFCITIVFLVLSILCVMVKLLTVVMGIKGNKKEVTENTGVLPETASKDWDTEVIQASSGELRLKNVDEKTAAIIMAIVSDDSQIPLSELCFKSIAAID